MKHLVIGFKGSIGSRHYRLLQEAGEEVIGWDLDSCPKCDPEYVWLCTPDCVKLEYFSAFSDKKVFWEKPLLHDITGNVYVATNYRFHPAVKVLKENLHKVGEVLYCRMHYSHYLPNQRKNWQEYMKTTNIVMDAGWHFVDLALWLFGKVNEWNTIDNSLELDCNDTGQFWLNHKRSFTYIWCDYLRRDKSWGIEVVGKEGTITLDAYSKNPEKVCVNFHDSIRSYQPLFLDDVTSDEPFKNQLQYLLGNWKSNIDEAIEVMKICGS